MARILIVDDDASLLQMMSLMLRRAGHTPILANDGYEGIEIARVQRPDLVVVDIMMPDLNGHEVCQILRDDPATAHIPLLVLTALSPHGQREMAAAAGADDFVTKPVTRDDLVSRVESLLRTGPRNIPEDSILDYAHPARRQPAAPTSEAPPAGQPLAAPPGTAHGELEPIIAVIGLAGGVGATTLAVNLGMSVCGHERVCIVDLHTDDGRAAIQLRMAPPRATWERLLDLQPGADKRLIGSALTFDQARGCALLAAPLQPVEEVLNHAQLEYILGVLAEAFPHIILNLPPELNEMTTAALRLARDVILVVSEDPSDLVAVGERLQRFREIGLSGEPLIVLNRTRPHGVSYEEVMEAVNRPLTANIPYEPAQVRALTEGVPLVQSQPDSLFSQAVKQLASQLWPSLQPGRLKL